METIALYWVAACMLLCEPRQTSLAVKIERAKVPPATSTTSATPANDSSIVQTSSAVPAGVSTTTLQSVSITTMRPPLPSPIKPNSSNATNSTKHDLQLESSVDTRIPKSDNCRCDLHIHYCDVNCCCDVDCNQDMLKSFVCHHQHIPRNSDLQQGLPACEINDGWLCIFKDNSIKDNYERYDMSFTPSRIYSWPNFFSEEVQSILGREYLIYGDDILLYSGRSNDVKTFDLPSTLINSHCHVFEPVRHMIDLARTCTMASEDFVNFYTAFFENSGFYKLVRSRKDIPPSNGAHIFDKSNYVPIEMSLCNSNGDLLSCVKVENETSLPSEGCWKLNINIQHNFTYLLGMNVSLVCTSTQEFSANPAKSFTVHFLRPNETISKKTENLLDSYHGYRPGMPVIAAKLFAVNDVSQENVEKYVISYFHVNNTLRTKHAKILLPWSDSGHCSDVQHEAIKFGENTVTQCSVAVANNSLLGSDSNFTSICEKLQGNLLRRLLNDDQFSSDYNLYVSELGRPLNTSTNWVRIDARNYEHREVAGTYDAHSNTFRCINMLLSVYYEFITARVTLNGQLHQNTIKRATVEFGDRVNLKFNLEEDLSISAFVYTRFYDATKNDSRSQTLAFYLLSIILPTIFLFEI